jgi:hypothetical protein
MASFHREFATQALRRVAAPAVPRIAQRPVAARRSFRFAGAESATGRKGRRSSTSRWLSLAPPSVKRWLAGCAIRLNRGAASKNHYTAIDAWRRTGYRAAPPRGHPALGRDSGRLLARRTAACGSDWLIRSDGAVGGPRVAPGRATFVCDATDTSARSRDRWRIDDRDALR